MQSNWMLGIHVNELKSAELSYTSVHVAARLRQFCMCDCAGSSESLPVNAISTFFIMSWLIYLHSHHSSNINSNCPLSYYLENLIWFLFML